MNVDLVVVVVVGVMMMMMMSSVVLLICCAQKRPVDDVVVEQGNNNNDDNADELSNDDGRSTAQHTSARMPSVHDINASSRTEENMSLATSEVAAAVGGGEYDRVERAPLNARPAGDITYDVAPEIDGGKSVKKSDAKQKAKSAADDRANATLDPNAVDKSKFKFNCPQCKNHYMTSEDLEIHRERRGHRDAAAVPKAAAAAAASVSVGSTVAMEMSQTIPPESAPESLASSSVPSWEIDFASLRLGKTLGQGAFGIVRVAEHGGEKVAVKMLKSFDADNHNLTDAETVAFQQEAELMRTLPPHRNVIRLIGVVTRTQPNCIVTQFAENGSLEAYLKLNRGKLSPTQRLTMCIDAANGVLHLHKHKLVHRDIAARNFLIDARGTILITDFGMTRAVVSDSGTTRARTGPLRYMPPESLQRQEYSTASDAWAFGVLMWEVESGARRRTAT
jgi:hypothetical protein